MSNLTIKILGTNQVFVDALPEWYLDVSAISTDIFAVSSSLVRLDKMGLIDLMYDRTAGDVNYEWVAQSECLQSVLKLYQSRCLDKELHLDWTRSILRVNDFGKQFAHACI